MTIRDVDELERSDHLGNKMKDRNIGWYEVKQAIENGSVEQANEQHQVRYRLDMPGVDLLVVVDVDRKRIVTTFYDDTQGASGGRL